MKDRGRGFVEWMWDPNVGVALSRREWGLGVTYLLGTFSVWLGPLQLWIEP